MKKNEEQKIKYSREDYIFSAINYFIAGIVIIIVLYPLIYIVSASFSSPQSIISGKVWLLPVKPTLNAYKTVFQNEDLLRAYGNTLFYTVLGTLINLVMTVLGAYPLSKTDLRGRGLVTVMITITMFFSGGMIPAFLLVNMLNLYNTFWALLLPSAVSVWNLFILRNYFQNSVPAEMLEAAHVDGCSNTRALLSIVLPLSKSILAVLVIFYAVGHWNSYFSALLYIDERAKYPLQVILREILILGMPSQSGTEVINNIDQYLQFESLKYALIIVASVPMLILYPILQRYFVKGVMVGSIKG